MSIVLVGSTSGSVTLQEPAVAGTTVLTLPAVSGTVLTTTSPKTGNVIQVVQGSVVTSTTSSTSSTFVTTGITASITPTSSSSKVLCFVNTSLDNNALGNQTVLTIYRNSTNVIDSGSTSGSGFNGLFNAGSRNQLSAFFAYLDSPATSSSTSYTLYFRSIGGGNITINNTCSSFVTLMEIAG
jgi:hypothetical protein